jgi:hypothetical protein
MRSLMIEGQMISNWFTQIERQPEVGVDGYDEGAEMLKAFFKQQLKKFIEPDLAPEGRKIIECCMEDGSLDDYESLMPHEPLIGDEWS